MIPILQTLGSLRRTRGSYKTHTVCNTVIKRSVWCVSKKKAAMILKVAQKNRTNARAPLSKLSFKLTLFMDTLNLNSTYKTRIFCVCVVGWFHNIWICVWQADSLVCVETRFPSRNFSATQNVVYRKGTKLEQKKSSFFFWYKNFQILIACKSYIWLK